MQIYKIAKKISDDTLVDFKNISKEILQLNLLNIMSDNLDLYKNVTFQGGTALRLCYNINRYSEDLDFTVNKKGKKFIEKFFTEISSKLKIEEKIETSIKSHGSMDIINVKIIPKQQIKNIYVKIEFMEVPSYTKEFKIAKDKYNLGINEVYIPTESLEEILADKIIALGGRPILDSLPFKSRDLWDISWLLNKDINFNFDLIIKKLNDYSIDKNNFLDILDKRINFINLQKGSSFFRDEMSRFVFGKTTLLLQEDNFINSVFKDVKTITEKTSEQLQKTIINDYLTRNI